MRWLFIFSFLCLSLKPQAQNTTFDIDSNTSDPALIAAMEYAAEIWGQHLSSEVPIKVQVFFFPVGTGTFLGLTIPNGRKNIPNVGQADTWYPTAMINAITGMEINPEEADMDIVINASYSFYTGLDGNPPANQYDFVSLFLHEIGHGLGVASLANVESLLGSFGQIEASQFEPYVPSFPFPDLEGMPSAYDRMLEDADGQLLTDTMLYPSVSPALETIFTSNQVYYGGMSGIAANGSAPVKVYAPGNFSFGSSITHLDQSTFAGTENSLMTPFLGTGNTEQEPGPVTLGILEDIGWTLYTTSSSETVAEQSLSFSVSPTIIRQTFQLHCSMPVASEIHLSLVDALGRRTSAPVRQFVPEGSQQLELNLSTFQAQNVNPGLYFLVLQSQTGQHTCRVVIGPN